MRRKIALILAVLTAAAMMLTACNPGTEETTSGTSSTASTANEGGSSSEEVNQDPVTITMVGEGELVTTLMGEKMKEYFPYITVEFYHPDGTGWVSNDMLITWAAAGTLPDIVTLQNPDVIYSNDLVIDLKPYFDADPDNVNYYQDIVQYSIINDTMMMLPYQKGTVATWAEASYWSQWDLNNEMYPGFEWDFYPIPVAEEGAVSRPCLIPDNYAITKSCQNVEAAYEVLKFFTYSKDGFNARYDIWKNYDPAALKEKYPEMAEVEGTIPDTMSFNLSPVDDQEVRDKWAELYNPKPGLKYIIDNMSTSKPYADGFKVIPGWEEVMTNTVLPAVTEQVISGEKTAAELAATLEEQVNAMQAEVMASMEQATS